MKKTLTLLLSGLLVLSILSGCGNPDRPDNGSETESFSETEAEVQQPNPATDFEYEINEEGGITITKYVGDKTEVIIPSMVEDKAVTFIGANAFSPLKKVTTVVIPDTVISIGNSAFLYNTNLKSVKMSKNIRSIEGLAFCGCFSLETIEFPNTLETIGGGSFSDCRLLKDIVLPNSLKSLGSEAFAGCTSLKHINIPRNCLDENNASQFTGSGLESVTIEEGVEVIPRCCFGGTKLQEVIFPSSLKEIHFEAFGGCEFLEKVVLNEGLIKIVHSAFRDTAIEEVIIPKTVVEFSEISFDTKTLKRVKFEGNAPQNFEFIVDNPADPSIEIQCNYTVYYHEGAEGFTSPKWYGYPTELW